MADDDLRFGDVNDDNGGGIVGGSGGIEDILIRIFTSLVILYVIIKAIEIVLDIPIPII
jgi:hypothetical protein